MYTYRGRLTCFFIQYAHMQYGCLSPTMYYKAKGTIISVNRRKGESIYFIKFLFRFNFLIKTVL